MKDIKYRFYNLLIGRTQAKEVAGKADDTSDDVTNDPNRKLLQVEKVTQRNKELHEKSVESFRESVRDALHKSLEERMVEDINDFPTVWELSRYDDDLTQLIDLLHVRAASIGRIEPLVSNIRWLRDDIIRLVNLPQYRRTDRNGKAQRVEGTRVALSYIGIENLQQVIPSFALRRMIPQITDPYPSLKRQLWEHSLGTALAAKKIAEINDENQSWAFLAGMFHDVGKLIVVRLYFKYFDSMQMEALKEAHEEKRIDEYDALRDIEPSATFLVELMQKYSPQLSQQVLGYIPFKRVMIKEAINEFFDDVPYKKMQAQSQILKQANAYSEFRMLKALDLINLAEAKKYILANNIAPASIANLKALNMKKLNLVMDEDE
jgi:HD-like signal output (HDOD) protein